MKTLLSIAFGVSMCCLLPSNGMAADEALAEVLFGDISPSGRLPISFPRTVGQLPLYYNTKPSGRGYEYTDLPGLQAQFPFGHGLSYSTFDYSDLTIRRTGARRCAFRSAGRNSPASARISSQRFSPVKPSADQKEIDHAYLFCAFC